MRELAGRLCTDLLCTHSSSNESRWKVVKNRNSIMLKQFFCNAIWDVKSAKEALLMLKDILKQEIPVQRCKFADCRGIWIIHPIATFYTFLFNVSLADRKIDKSENRNNSKEISGYLWWCYFSLIFLSIKKYFYSWNWRLVLRLLEIEPSSSNDEGKEGLQKNGNEISSWIKWSI